MKHIKQFNEASSGEIKVGDITNKGKVVWVDNKGKNPDNTDMDRLIKLDIDHPVNKWARESELEILPQEDKSENKSENKSDDLKSEIDFSTAMSVDIRICEVTDAQKVKGKDRLIQLTVDTGFDKRTIVTNLGLTYDLDDFKGKKFPFILNLKPAMIAKIQSNGMIIASEYNGNVSILPMDLPIGTKIL